MPKIKIYPRSRFYRKVNLFLAEALNNLGLYYYAEGKYREAEMKLEECQTKRKKYLNNYDPYIFQTFNHFCFLYENWGKLAKAEKSYLELIKINKEIHKFKPQKLAPLYESLGNIYINQLEFSKAEESFKLRQKYFPSDQDISISYYWFG